MIYVIRTISGKLIEAHDSLSYQWALDKVITHNKLYPFDQWIMTQE